jgi:two-component system sensor histidine kinase CpxA
MRLHVPHSLGGRILLLGALNLLLLAGMTAIALGIGTAKSLQDFMLLTAETRVFDVSRQIAVEMPTTPYGQLDALLAKYSSAYDATFVLTDNTGKPVAGAPIVLPDQVRSRLLVRQGAALFQTPPRNEPLPVRTPFFVIATTAPRYWVGVRIPIRSASSPDIVPGTLVIASTTFFGSALLFAPGKWLAWVAVALALGLLCWVPFLRSLTRRVAQMEQATARIADGRFATALDTRHQDELGRLAASIERMAQRLGAQVAAQKRFLGDTAHELRSPLARMQVALAILDRGAPEHPEYLESLKEEVTEMSRLTDDLLRLAREELLTQTSVAVPTNVTDAVQRAVRLECRAGERVEVHVPSTLAVMMDPDSLVRAISNVLRNALRYAGDAGPITITAQGAGALVDLVIADEGPGVPPHALERLFEPFYRVDAARDRKTGGVGQ